MTIEKCGERKWSVSSCFAVHSFSFAVFLWIAEMGSVCWRKKICLLWEKRAFFCFTVFLFCYFGKQHCVAEERFFFSSLSPSSYVLSTPFSSSAFVFFFLLFLSGIDSLLFPFRKNKSFSSKMYFFPLFRKRQDGSISGSALCAHSNQSQ